MFGGEIVWHAEIDKAASKVLAHRFPGVPNLGSVTDIDWATVPPVDVLCGGFPCFPAGTLIDAGEDGLRPIETLRVGDMVLTHERRRRQVTSVMRREADDVLVVNAMGTPSFKTTAEHPFWVRKRLSDSYENGNRVRNYSEPEWVLAGELNPRDMLGMPLDDVGSDPIIGESLAYVVGRWLGDGWLVDHKRTSNIIGKRGSRVNSRVHKAIICAAYDEADELASAITAADLHATRADDRTVVKFHISSAEFVKLLRQFGRGAANKRLPGWVFTAPSGEQAALLKGWLDADGCRNVKPPQWRGATISEQLGHGMSRLARNVYQVATSLHHCPRAKTAVIEGRTVKQQDGYELVIPDRNREAFIEDGFAWVPVRSVTEGEPCEVFNISVDEDESYVAWGIAVHNCTDVSAAGKRAGMHGTRSGLWSHMAEAIDVLRPRFVVIENVRGLLNANANRPMEPGQDALGEGADRPVLRAIGAVLGDICDIGGYEARWVTVAAADVGAPHRRERVFILAADATLRSGVGLQQQDLSALQQRRGDRRPGQPGVCDCGNPACVADASHSPRDGRHEGRPEPAGIVGGFDVAVSGDEPGVALLPTPCVVDRLATTDMTLEQWDESRRSQKERGVGSFGPRGDSLGAAVLRVEEGTVDERPDYSKRALLPTPQAHDGQGPKTPEQVAVMRAKGYGVRNLNETAVHELLSTPQSRDYKGVPGDNFNTANLCRDVANTSRWGKYAPAISRWEALTRPAPSPTEPNSKGNPRLSAAFSEWLMGWPEGWVTDPAIGISRNDQLRIVGNGVVSLQCEYALRYLLAVTA